MLHFTNNYRMLHVYYANKCRALVNIHPVYRNDNYLGDGFYFMLSLSCWGSQYCSVYSGSNMFSYRTLSILLKYHIWQNIDYVFEHLTNNTLMRIVSTQTTLCIIFIVFFLLGKHIVIKYTVWYRIVQKLNKHHPLLIFFIFINMY